MQIKKYLLEVLRNPELKGIDIDDPNVLAIHAGIIRRKPFLFNLYKSFYQEFVSVSKAVPQGLLVELGSGGGFLKECLPEVITSDIVKLENIDKSFSAEKMPFADNEVSAFFMFDVFHHIANAEIFLKEAQRCLKKDGRLVMIEPANTLWGRFIFRNFHHEQFNADSSWQIDNSRGPLAGANIALPWIIFVRDRKIFEEKFPGLEILRYQPHTPIRFIVSGGISYKSLLPGFMIPAIGIIEYILSPFNKSLGMFATIELKKIIDK